jgi:hypothetical protein
MIGIASATRLTARFLPRSPDPQPSHLQRGHKSRQSRIAAYSPRIYAKFRLMGRVPRRKGLKR